MTHLNNGTAAGSIGIYQGDIAPEFNNDLVREQLVQITGLLKNTNLVKLSNGPDYVVKVPLQTPQGEIFVALKIFKRQNWLKDRFDRKHKSKAERSYNAARYLQQHKIGTPAPIAWLDRWENERLQESYFLTVFQPAICFRDALSDVYFNIRNNENLMDLLHLVAPAINAMHAANFFHGDLGNQNILLPKNSDGTWAQPQFIDLNRCTMPNRPLTDKERAFDLSRPILPGNYLNFFKYIYCNHQMPSAELEKYETKFRARFSFHRKSRHFRHPLRYLKNLGKPPKPDVYPDPKDYWLWDEKSAQPMIALSRKEKHRERFLSDSLRMIGQGLATLPALYGAYKKVKQQSFQQPVVLKNRIGVALHPRENYIDHELKLLGDLGNPPVLVRVCHHEDETIWNETISLVQRLHRDNIEIMVAVLQDREAVLRPEKWVSFLQKIIPAIADIASHIEITHAYNRIKWGVWNMQELQNLLAPAFELQKQFPQIKFTGPACIDFEYLPVIAALKSLPKEQSFAALSHLLYVDRRGAPENPQGMFSTLEKCALLKALTTISPQCEDKVIISEVNWPVENTGIWSPIVCPYVTPKWKEKPSGEPEDDYANFMLRYIAIAICSGHVEQVFWWRLSAKGYGLVDDQDNFRIRAAFTALQYFFVRLGDATFIKKWSSAKNTYILEFHNSTQQILMAWTTKGEVKELPNFDAQKIYSRDGELVKDPVISESPIYLVRPL
ncbi:MAG: lipopolysaccharide kinase InaA family protein [Cellvibrio sp.]